MKVLAIVLAIALAMVLSLWFLCKFTKRVPPTKSSHPYTVLAIQHQLVPDVERDKVILRVWWAPKPD